ncbi:MAG: DUF2298 domain-containing protein, partial [Chloroflexota bacterium]|nr:DUF2298 domain-containing protein [Chloroflexota bacterium]
MLVQASRTRRSALNARFPLPWLLGLILVLAAVPRFLDIGWDGGHYAHPDELHIVDVAIDRLHVPGRWAEALYADTSPLNPRRLQPDSTQHYSYSYGTLLVYTLKAVSNLFATVFGDRFATWESIYMVARPLAAFADLVTVLAVFLVGRRLFDQRVGLLAAAFSALTVLQVQYSHFYVAEPLMVMFLMLGLYSAVRTVQCGQRRWAAAAGMFLGLAVATKPSAAAFLPAAGLLVLWGGRCSPSFLSRARRGVGNVLAMSVLATLGWAIFEPYAVLDFPTYVDNILSESRIQQGTLDYPYTRQYIGSVPVWYHLSQYVRWSVGLPLGLVAVAGLGWAVYRVLRAREPAPAALLVWVFPYTLSILTLETKWLRYMLPITPVLAILGASLLWCWHDRARWSADKSGPLSRWRSRLPTLAMVSVLVGTALWVLAFTRVYMGEHPWITASRWITREVPAGSTLGVEHWDAQLPWGVPVDPGRYQHFQIEMYDDLRPEQKLEQVKRALQQSDYIVLASNRLYDSIPRSPWRYAVASRYYDLLFEERLGFVRAQQFRVAPSLGPVSIPDQHADESFTVYDHPTVTIFRKVRELRPWEYQSLFHDALLAPWEPARHGTVEKSLLLASPRQPHAIGLPYFEGADVRGWGAGALWLLVVEVLGLAAWVLCRPLVGGLPDGGWVLAKLTGVAFLSWLAWLLPSVGLMPAGSGTTLLLFVALCGAAALFALLQPAALVAALRARWRAMLGFEVLFLTLLAAGSLLRSANPDLWQPYFGGEKPMELAFINGILRSPRLPPYDPWYADGHINYYYFGQWIAATLMRASSVAPRYGFNLAVATVFALTGALAASIGYSVARAMSRRVRLLAGGLSLLLVLLAGNLEGVVQVWRLWQRGGPGEAWRQFDFFYQSTRVIANTINEFPYFTFLYADLHAHMVAMPLGLALVLLGVQLYMDRTLRVRGQLGIAALGGLLAGAIA